MGKPVPDQHRAGWHLVIGAGLPGGGLQGDHLCPVCELGSHRDSVPLLVSTRCLEGIFICSGRGQSSACGLSTKALHCIHCVLYNIPEVCVCIFPF